MNEVKISVYLVRFQSHRLLVAISSTAVLLLLVDRFAGRSRDVAIEASHFCPVLVIFSPLSVRKFSTAFPGSATAIICHPNLTLCLSSVFHYRLASLDPLLKNKLSFR